MARYESNRSPLQQALAGIAGLRRPVEVDPHGSSPVESGSNVLRRLLAPGSDPIFRAGADQHGDWYVWRRVSASGWATMRKCESRADAELLARQLATESVSGEFAG